MQTYAGKEAEGAGTRPQLTPISSLNHQSRHTAAVHMGHYWVVGAPECWEGIGCSSPINCLWVRCSDSLSGSIWAVQQELEEQSKVGVFPAATAVGRARKDCSENLSCGICYSLCSSSLGRCCTVGACKEGLEACSKGKKNS